MFLNCTNSFIARLQIPLDYIKNKLATVRGHLVEAQMDFLKDQGSWTSDDSVDWRGLNPVGHHGFSTLQLH